MRLEDLKPGAYELAQDVENPMPDRRGKHDWRDWAKWERGMRFVARTYRPDEAQHTRIELQRSGDYSQHNVTVVEGPDGRRMYGGLRAKQTEALLRHLVPANESVKSLLTRLSWHNWHSPLLDRLCKMRKINLADIEAACAAEAAAPEDEPDYCEEPTLPLSCSFCGDDIGGFIYGNEVGALKDERYCTARCAVDAVKRWVQCADPLTLVKTLPADK